MAVLDESSFEILVGRDILFYAVQNMLLNSKHKCIQFDKNNVTYVVQYKTIEGTSPVVESWLTDLVVARRTLG